MSTKTTAAQLLAQLRANSAPIQSTAARQNVKAPIAQPDQATIRAYIEATQPAFMLAFHDIAIQTGHRTNDIAALTYSAVDWSTGTLTVTVSKQTLAAQARAYSRGLREIREARQAAALAAGDAVAYMQAGAMSRDELAAVASPAQLDRLQQLLDKAPRKVSTMPLSADLLARLKVMRDQNFMDDYIFSRYQTSSNSTRMVSGHHITRQTFWAKFKAIFEAVASQIQNALKLSAYSLRKTFCRNLYEASGRSIAAVMKIVGHSTEAMTLKYLGCDDEAARVQAVMVGGAHG